MKSLEFDRERKIELENELEKQGRERENLAVELHSLKDQVN